VRVADSCSVLRIDRGRRSTGGTRVARRDVGQCSNVGAEMAAEASGAWRRAAVRGWIECRRGRQAGGARGRREAGRQAERQRERERRAWMRGSESEEGGCRGGRGGCEGRRCWQGRPRSVRVLAGSVSPREELKVDYLGAIGGLATINTNSSSSGSSSGSSGSSGSSSCGGGGISHGRRLCRGSVASTRAAWGVSVGWQAAGTGGAARAVGGSGRERGQKKGAMLGNGRPGVLAAASASAVEVGQSAKPRHVGRRRCAVC
jgi:hypothetical protein